MVLNLPPHGYELPNATTMPLPDDLPFAFQSQIRLVEVLKTGFGPALEHLVFIKLRMHLSHVCVKQSKNNRSYMH